MDNIQNSEILKLFLISTLLIITPLLSSSLRTTYLYFLVNLLIIALGAEAGLLSFFSNKTTAPHPTSSEPSFSDQKRAEETTANPKINSSKVEIKCANSDEKIKGVKKCPSTPSLFFIEEDENGFVEEEEEEEEEDEVMSGQELFNKAETFIGDFYKQLKMQREESWNSLQDI
nr:LIM and calponin domains-containing protein 1, putative [Ipomoea batatas]